MPTTQEFITKTTQELQDARAMRGGSRSPSAAHHPGEGAELHASIDIPGLNMAASQERFWPSRAGCCEGPPHSYVRMPFGLPSAASSYQRNLRRLSVCSLERAFQAASIEDHDSKGENPPEAVPKKKKTSPSSRPQEVGISGGVASGSAPVQGAPPSIA